MNVTDSQNLVSKRLFIGGLATNITSKEVSERFSRFGKITDLNLTVRKDESGSPFKCFAHLNIEGDETNIKRCFDAYQNSKWKGSVLKLQYAKENFVSRLQKERESNSLEGSSTQQAVEPPIVSAEWEPPQFDAIKGSALPGTPIPGKKDWVVGKYGRILPILKVKKSSKTVKHDPSKLCHAMKVFKEDSQAPDSEHAQCASLTWEIDTPDSDITRKRKGQFPVSPNKQKHRKSDPTKQVIQFLDSLKASRKDLEVVSQRQGALASKSESSLKSNKFDSDRESDSGDDDGDKIQNSPQNRRDIVKQLQTSTERDSKVQRMESAVKKSNKFIHENENSIPEFKGLTSLSGNDSLNIPRPSCDAVVSNSQKKFEKRTKKNVMNNEVNIIQEFKGLGMISSAASVVNNKEELPLKTHSPKPQKETSPLGKQQKQTKNHQDNKETANMRLRQNSDNERQPSHEPVSPLKRQNEPSVKLGKKRTGKSSVPKENTVKFSDDSNCNDSDDSVSSADSYEIIARKKRKSISHDDVLAKNTVSKSALQAKSVNKQKEKTRAMNISQIDQSLSFSEFDAGDVDLIDCEVGEQSENAREASDDSHDSDLDDNDFELVAKKLAQKAGIATSKLAKKQKKVPVSSPIGLSTERSKADMNSGPPDSQSNKKLTANEKRLQAVKEQMKTKQRQQAAMHKALSNVDTGGKHKIVFSSDDDNDEDDKEHESVKTSCQDTSTSSQSASKPRPGPALFEDSDSESEDSDVEDLFKSRPQFEGKKGEKLMELERKIGDKRFTLDEKFAESDSEEDKTKDEAETSLTNPLQEERAANIKVLENVIGKSKLDQFTAKIKRNTKHIIDMNTVRFDPTKIKPQVASPSTQSGKKKMDQERKVEFLDTTKEKQKQRLVQDSPSAETKTDGSKLREGKQEKGKKLKEKSKSTKPKSSVELSTSLVSLFKKKGDQTEEEEEENSFSLLSQFDHSDTAQGTESSNPRPLSGLLAAKSNTEAAFSPGDSHNESIDAQSSSSDEEDEDEDEETLQSESSKLESSTQDANITAVDSDEEKLDEEDESDEQERFSSDDETVDTLKGKDHLDAGRPDVRFTKEQWLDKWQDLRSTIVRLYKKKHKDAVKSKKLHSEAKRRKDFVENSRRMQWFHKKRNTRH